MAQYHTNIADVPIILVGTQDAISESNPRLIDDTRARKLASDLKRCAYYETCATYGLNVERVFQDGMWNTFKPVFPFLITCFNPVITFCMSCRRRKMYSGHGHLCVSVPCHIPRLLHGPGCNLGEWKGCPIVVLHWADLQSVHGFCCYDSVVSNMRNVSKCLYSLCAWLRWPINLLLIFSVLN